mgnify:CR=1 FL=1
MRDVTLNTIQALPQPFTLEQMQNDILNLYLLQLRMTSLFTNDQRVWTLAGKSGIKEGEIWIGDTGTEEFHLVYADVQDSLFARALEQQYSFGFFGFDNLLCEPMEMDTIHTWVAAYLIDMQGSNVVSEWISNGADIYVGSCIHACELANARNILEGGESFFPYTPDDSNKVDEVGALTVHQMALLAGMEEMTIRTAISRKGPNQLKAFKDDRRTLIKIEDAKAWLAAKGRHVSVTRQSHAGAHLDLEKTGFLSIAGFSHAMARRVTYLDEVKPEAKTIEKLVELVANAGMKTPYIKDRDDLLNAPLMGQVAQILELPHDLFVLRAQEAVLRDDLAQTEAAVKEASTASHSS